MKKCFKCGEEKELTEFYKHKQMADGHLNKCKICTRKDSSSSYEVNSKSVEWLNKERDRTRERYHRLNYKEKYSGDNLSESSKESQRKARKKYGENRPWTSNSKYKNLKKDLKIPNGFNGHHWNYNEEYLQDVVILTNEDHYTIHRFLKLDLNTLMFIDKETGELLNSREKHESFISRILKDIEKGVKTR